MVPVEHKTHKAPFREWKCGSCDKLLGLIYKDGTLAVKYKDLVAWATGEYKTICRYCKSVNIYQSDVLLNIDNH